MRLKFMRFESDTREIPITFAQKYATYLVWQFGLFIVFYYD